MSLVDAKHRPKSAAPGQYLGYALQPVRLCHHLLNAPNGSLVSLEYVEDIAVHYPDGSCVLEQVKSALSANPVADKSLDLWKAFANWGALCAASTIDPAKTAFRIYVAPEKTASLVSEMHAATTIAAAKPILEKIKKEQSSRKAPTAANLKIDEFLAGGDGICLRIIANFCLLSEPDPLESVRVYLRALLPETVIDDFAKAAIGRAKETVDELIRGGAPPVIAASEFRKLFRAFVMKHNLAGILISTTPPPSGVAVETLLKGAPIFVRQLEAIQADRDLVVSAVSDYLRSSSDKVDWAEKGLILEESLNDLDDGLKRHYQLTRDEIEDLHPSVPAPVRGRTVYRQCMRLQLPLEGRSVPSHFVPGSYQSLADAMMVGWHPEYKKLFDGG
jgi:hypothetical protein